MWCNNNLDGDSNKGNRTTKCGSSGDDIGRALYISMDNKNVKSIRDFLVIVRFWHVAYNQDVVAFCNAT